MTEKERFSNTLARAFLLDRLINWVNRVRARQDLKHRLHVELETVRGKVSPQTDSVVMLYPDIWDSAVSSGELGLLDANEVVKLAEVYRFVKGTQYEAEWVRRSIEEYNNVPATEKERRDWLKDRFTFLWARHNERGEKLTTRIDEIFQDEQLWDC